MKWYFIDGAVGLVIAFVAFFIAPFLLFSGNWELLDIGAFPAFLIGVFIFLFYNRTPLYKRLHTEGVRPFSSAFIAYLMGAAIGYGVVVFLAAFSILQWSPAI